MNYIKPRHLDVFITVADSGSVRVSAKQLNLTQPAVSMAIMALENQLGEPLFLRQKKRLYLNEAGHKLLIPARRLLQHMQALPTYLKETNHPLHGCLRLGASNTVGNYLVGDLLGSFTHHQPQVTIQLEVGNTEAIAEKVRRHQLDLGCVEGLVLQPDIETIPWRKDALVVCAGKDHPLSHKKHLAPNDFAGATWIMREAGSATRALSEHALSTLPPGRAVLELGQVEAIKQAVIARLGIGFLPKVAIQDALALGHLKQLSTPFLALQRQLSLIKATHGSDTVLNQTFISSIL